MLLSNSDGFDGVPARLDGVVRPVGVVPLSRLSRLSVGVLAEVTDGFRFAIAEAGLVGVVVLFVIDLDGVVRGGGADCLPVGVAGSDPVDALSIS